MKLPEREYLRFDELALRWKCTKTNLFDLIRTQEIIPSVYLHGGFDRVQVQRNDDGKLYPKKLISDDEQSYEIRQGFHFLNYLAFVSTTRGGTPFFSEHRVLKESDICFRFEGAIELNLDLISDEFLPLSRKESYANDVVFMQEEIERFEQTHKRPEIDQRHTIGNNLEKDVTPKSETNYLNIIGSLCDLYWHAANPNQPKINQSKIIAALERYNGFAGMSERNLKEKLSKAIKAILNE